MFTFGKHYTNCRFYSVKSVFKTHRNLPQKGFALTHLHLIDPARFSLRGTLEIGEEVVIDVNVIIEGKVKLGNHVSIGAGAVLKECEMGDHSELKT